MKKLLTLALAFFMLIFLFLTYIFTAKDTIS
jgi:hypothetical protein